MSKFPKRIYATRITGRDVFCDTRKGLNSDVEYVRADLVPAPEIEHDHKEEVEQLTRLLSSAHTQIRELREEMRHMRHED